MVRGRRLAWGLGAMGTALAFAGPGFAQAQQDQMNQLKSLQDQVHSLQKQLNEIEQAPQPASPLAGAIPPGASPVYWTKDGLRMGGVNFKFGGFIEAAGIYRSNSEVADVGSPPFSNIPLNNVATGHLNELRGSARQSRISLLFDGDPDQTTHLTAYFETDFLSAGTTSNSNESNSYSLRVRHAYTTLDKSDWGFHALLGQSWSFLTQFRNGMEPRMENIPLTIDAQYVAGFTWTRQAQYRMWFDAAPGVEAGLSVESPQTTFGGTTPAGTIINAPGAGGGLLNGAAAYSLDYGPDVIGKIAFDPGFGHYELYGIARFMQDRTVGAGNHVQLAGGAGASALLPVIPHLLDVQASFLGGPGVGRYSSSGLPDATLSPSGSINPIVDYMLLTGLVAHPVGGMDAYIYFGGDRSMASYSSAGGTNYGWGNPLYSNAACYLENASVLSGSGSGAGGCSGNTKWVFEITPGVWQDVYKGDFGTFRVGLEYEFVRRDTFNGVGGNPHAIDNIVMTSVRYYPF